MHTPDLQSIASQWQQWLKSAPVPLAPPMPPAVDIAQLQATLDPAASARLQQEYSEQLGTLWQDMLASRLPLQTDRRFSSPAWQTNPMHAFNAAAYQLNARFLIAMADQVKASRKVRQRIRFSVQQMIDAMAPSNFLATNPEAHSKLLETRGESLTRGVAQLLEDLKKGRISQTDERAFEVGRNVATTEGAVVFENPFFQLLQYKPLTAEVHARPLLIVPPCINKYYILDLQPDNSLVRYAVEQGNTVFLVSWRNADATLAHATWDDYVTQGAMEAIRVTQDISGQDQINALGFCVGGTLLSTSVALLAGRGQKPVSSLTLLTSFLDFSDTGVLDVYIDEAQVAAREQAIGQGGLMTGRDFSSAFSSLRPNDLVWNYVNTNYLKGEQPPAFDLLYWNSDSTNLPGPMFCWYLRHTYLEDSLKTPGKLSVGGEKIDLGKIDAPTFIYASRDDHIVPWTSAYQSMRLLNPKKPARNRFVLGASGHIAGVINPASKNKRNYWINQAAAPDAEAWLQSATEAPGSWWPQWAAFLAEHGGKARKAPRAYGNARFKPIEAAPGRYVKARAD